MEVYYYRCALCGYVHQTPAYWMSYAPEEQIEQPHPNPHTGALCTQQQLAFDGEGDEG